MTDVWEKLITQMAGILDLYRTVLEMGNRKREVLVKGNIPELEALVKQEEVLLMQIQKLDWQRSVTISEIAAHYQIKQALSLQTVKDLADEASASRLAVVQQELADVIKRLVSVNKLNGELTQQALQFVNYSINLMTQTTPDPNYAVDGQMSDRTPVRRVFDSKA